MDITHGLLLFFIGCTVTFLGFFMAFLVINYNKKKELQKLEENEIKKKMPHHYYGDDTVWQNQNIQIARTGLET